MAAASRKAWLPDRESRSHRGEQTGGKSPEGQGIVAAPIVVQGVVEEEPVGRSAPLKPASTFSGYEAHCLKPCIQVIIELNPFFYPGGGRGAFLGCHPPRG